jgi:hypothetical protein
LRKVEQNKIVVNKLLVPFLLNNNLNTYCITVLSNIPPFNNGSFRLYLFFLLIILVGLPT